MVKFQCLLIFSDFAWWIVNIKVKNQCLLKMRQSMTWVFDPPSPLCQWFPFILDIELWTQSLKTEKGSQFPIPDGSFRIIWSNLTKVCACTNSELADLDILYYTLRRNFCLGIYIHTHRAAMFFHSMIEWFIACIAWEYKCILNFP